MRTWLSPIAAALGILSVVQSATHSHDRVGRSDAAPPRSFRIEIVLPANRDKQGELRLIDPLVGTLAGPFPVLGQDWRDAVNGTLRDPLRINGPTPLGSYRVSAVVRTGPAGPIDPTTGAPIIRYPTTSYGNYAIIALSPVGGQALQAKNVGRTGLLIHAGGIETAGRLSPTNGCVRIGTLHQRGLIDMLISLSNGSAIGVDVVITSGGAGGLSALSGTVGDADPPPSSAGMPSLVAMLP